MIEERNKGIILGAEDYLVKPVTRHQLAITLSKYHIGDESQNLVMIIDDDDIVRDTMAEILKKAIHNFVRFVDARNGWV